MTNYLKQIGYPLLIITCGLISISSSCKKENIRPDDYTILTNLPKDTGGTQKAVYYNADIPYGYYVYTPSGYNSNNAIYPLLVFLHGSGEKGNSLSDTSVLKKVLVHGPPKLIKNKTWNPKYPMVVVSPQCHESGWNGKKIHALIKHITDNYRINTKRIYLAGLSMGGYGTFNYVETCSDTSYVAAVVPICGGGNAAKGLKFQNIPLWAFHGDADKTVLPINSMNMVDSINKYNPVVKAKLTIFPGVGHDSWTRTYDGSGMGSEDPAYDPFNMTIYDWMFQYTK
jgi:predicted peptidase